MALDKEVLEEIKKIREILEPKPKPEPKPGTEKKGFQKFKDDFLEFLKKYKVMGLAVGFIMGIYLGELVKALVTDLIMPIIGLIIPGIAWDEITLGPFLIGHFIGALITFLIVALVIYWLVKFTAKIGLE